MRKCNCNKCTDKHLKEQSFNQSIEVIKENLIKLMSVKMTFTEDYETFKQLSKGTEYTSLQYYTDNSYNSLIHAFKDMMKIKELSKLVSDENLLTLQFAIVEVLTSKSLIKVKQLHQATDRLVEKVNNLISNCIFYKHCKMKKEEEQSNLDVSQLFK